MNLCSGRVHALMAECIPKPRVTITRRWYRVLDGLDGKVHEVADEGHLFLDEGLGVADAGEQTVVPGGGEGALADVGLGDKETAAAGLIGVLGAIGEERLEAGLDVGRDVDHKGRADIGVERGVEDLVGAVGRVAAWEGEAGETTAEAGLVAERGGGVVIGVTALPIGEDDDARAEASEDGGDLEAVALGVFDVAVGEVEGFAMADVEDAGGVVRFPFALVGGAAGAGLAAGEVEDAGGPAEVVHGEEGAAAGLFDVVTVRGDGKEVDCCGLLHLSSGAGRVWNAEPGANRRR